MLCFIYRFRCIHPLLGHWTAIGYRLQFCAQQFRGALRSLRFWYVVSAAQWGWHAEMSTVLTINSCATLNRSNTEFCIHTLHFALSILATEGGPFICNLSNAIPVLISSKNKYHYYSWRKSSKQKKIKRTTINLSIKQTFLPQWTHPFSFIHWRV